MKLLKLLWARTRLVAATYTGTFIVVIVLNQLIFFGLCLNPICLIAAMPHCLAITVVLGTLLNKINGWGADDKKQIKRPTSTNKSSRNPDRKTDERKSNNTTISNKPLTTATSTLTLGPTEREAPETLEPSAIRVKYKKSNNINCSNGTQEVCETSGSNKSQIFVPQEKIVNKIPLVSAIHSQITVYDKSQREIVLEAVIEKGQSDLRKRGISFMAERFRKNLVKLNINNLKTRTSPLCFGISTTSLGRTYGINASPYLFDLFKKNGLITRQNNIYQLTSKGQQIGGSYKVIDEDNKWIIWDEEKISKLLLDYKKKELDKLPFQSFMHIGHIENVETILGAGLLPHDNKYKKIDISNKDVNSRRVREESIFKNSIHDYVPFYFNVRNAMLFQVQKQYGSDIVVFSFSKDIALSKKTIFTDGNAAANNAIFIYDIHQVKKLDWSSIFSQQWSDNGITNKSAKSKVMSECLVYGEVDSRYIQTIYCSTIIAKNKIDSLCKKIGQNIDVQVDKSMFFFADN